MKLAETLRAAVGPVRAIGAAFTAVMLTAFAQPVAANFLTAQSNTPYEGHDLEISFTTGWTSNYHLRYKYETQDGSAESSGRNRDYESTFGYLRWEPLARTPTEDVIVETVQDQLCEYDETLKVILYDPEWSSNYVRFGWGSHCYNNRGVPCRFEVEVTIKQHADGCTAGRFGE